MAVLSTERIPPRPRIAVDYVGSGPLVLFLHGLGGNREGWRDLLHVIGDRYLAVAWDARGQGDSDGYDGPLRFRDLSADIIRVMTHFEAARAHLVGQSMGAVTALDFYERHPGRVASLILAGTGGSLRWSMTDKQVNEWLEIRRKPLVDGGDPRTIASAVARNVLSAAAPRQLRERVIATVSASRRGSYLKAIEALAGHTPTLDPGAVRVPTLVIVGEEDRVTSPELARRLASRIHGAELRIIRRAGHLSHIERPARFAELVLEFLMGSVAAQISTAEI